MLALPAFAMPVREALGQIETGDNDNARGRAGEVSRFQIMPRVWARYSHSTNYNNEAIAWGVAKAILEARSSYFIRSHNRPPTPFEIYVLWNAPGQIDRPKRVVSERAIRFSNLIDAP
jgi:hypothetical protein